MCASFYSFIYSYVVLVVYIRNLLLFYFDWNEPNKLFVLFQSLTQEQNNPNGVYFCISKKFFSLFFKLRQQKMGLSTCTRHHGLFLKHFITFIHTSFPNEFTPRHIHTYSHTCMNVLVLTYIHNIPSCISVKRRIFGAMFCNISLLSIILSLSLSLSLYIYI